MVLVNLSNLCWTNGYQSNNQEIFARLLNGKCGFDEGFFLQPPILKTAKTFQLIRVQELEREYPSAEMEKPYTVLQPVLTLSAGYPAAATTRAIAEVAQRFLKNHLRGRPYVLWINSLTHFQSQLAEQLMARAKLRIFDSADMLVMCERNGGEHFTHASSILAACDFALSGAAPSLSGMEHPAKLLVSPARREDRVHPSVSAVGLAPLFPKPEAAVYIGFTGSLTEDRIDFDLLHAALTRHPNYHFIFVGSANRSNLLSRLKAYPNFHSVADQQADTYNSILRSFDVAIVPELDSEHIRGRDTHRVAGYLAHGIPVLSSSRMHQEMFGDAVSVATSVWEFCNMLERLVAGSHQTEATVNGSGPESHQQDTDWSFGGIPIERFLPEVLSTASQARVCACPPG
jgi:hypothetical protein